MGKHTAYDLAQMQSLPLEAKIRMTKQRIQQWYESWVRYEIYNKKTGKTRFVTATQEPPLKENEYVSRTYDGQVYVSISGGKDSTVLKHIVDSMYDDVPAVFVNTGLEYPEIQSFVRDIKAGKYDCFNAGVEIIRPEMRFDEVIRTHGYPLISKEISERLHYAQRGAEWAVQCLSGNNPDGTRSEYKQRGVKYGRLIEAPFNVSHKCCAVMKKSPIKKYESRSGRRPFIGTMASESQLRRTAWLRNGCNSFDAKRPTSQPMSFWTEQDVLLYIKKYNVPYCSVYGDIVVKGEDGYDYVTTIGDMEGEKLKTTGCNRTGCIFCTFGSHIEKTPNRFQRLKKTHPKQYEYCIGGGEMKDGKWQPNKEGLGLGKVLDYIGVKYD